MVKKIAAFDIFGTCFGARMAGLARIGESTS
jgi:hypothetical protein